VIKLGLQNQRKKESKKEFNPTGYQSCYPIRAQTGLSQKFGNFQKKFVDPVQPEISKTNWVEPAQPELSKVRLSRLSPNFHKQIGLSPSKPNLLN